MFDQYVATITDETNNSVVSNLADMGVVAEASPLNTGYSIITIDPEAQTTNVVADALAAGDYRPSNRFPFVIGSDFHAAYTNFKAKHPNIDFAHFHAIRNSVATFRSIFG